MSNPFVGEVRPFAGNFAPIGWLECAGQLLPIANYEDLFALIGVTYGGDGRSTFALPDLQGRTPIHAGTNSSTGTSYTIGHSSGAESVTLVTNQIPAHTHTLVARGAEGDMSSPSQGFGILSNSTFAAALDKVMAYGGYDAAHQVLMASGVGPPSHADQPHENMQPFVAITYIIATAGIFPSRS
jgi:microcystin-dependent protein